MYHSLMNLLRLLIRTAIGLALFWGVVLAITLGTSALPSCAVPTMAQLPPGFQRPALCAILEGDVFRALRSILIMLVFVLPALTATFVFPRRLMLTSRAERIAVFVIVEVILILSILLVDPNVIAGYFDIL